MTTTSTKWRQDGNDSPVPVTIDYEDMQIPAVKIYEGEKFFVCHESDALMEQVEEFVNSANVRYAEWKSGLYDREDCDPCFPLLDAIKVLRGAMDAIDKEH
jgi:hypothetical protein